MKTSRIFASSCLLFSSVALIMAAKPTVGDQPGVVRLSAMRSPTDEGAAGTPTPVPDAGISGVQGAQPAGPMGPPMVSNQPGPYPTPGNYSPYFSRSYGATQAVPNAITRQQFGPIMMYEANIDNGLGFGQGYHRANVRIPYHVIPNTTVLIGDLSAAVTNGGDPLFNYGLISRNYDESRNRIFGWNVYGDHDPGYGNASWNRVGGGFESLGKYLDIRANGYVMTGKDSVLLTDQLIGNLVLTGNTVNRIRHQTRENAYSGFDMEMGGPLPVLGRYGMNMYGGLYYLTNDYGFDTTGFQARWEALITESVTVNTYLTTDDTFGTNSWVSLQFSFPSYRNRSILRPRQSVRSRLQDPTVRHNRSFNNIDVVDVPEAIINPNTGLPWNILYVDPNNTVAGVGTFENPFMTLEQAQTANSGLVDIIRVTPNADDSGTNLTVAGGLDLFDDQVLLSSTKNYTLFTSGGIDFLIPATATATNLGPLISNPANTAGDAVVHLANNNTILGMRINAANATNTDFGDGVANALPITDVNLTMNTFTNHITGANLADVGGTTIIDMNTFTGRAGTSVNGLLLSSGAGSTMELLVRDNTATDHSGVGFGITAHAGSTINADDLNGIGGQVTGITGNTSNLNGTGFDIAGDAGSTLNIVMQNNSAIGNTGDGLTGTSDGATFNLASLRNNYFGNEDVNGNGILDAGEDINASGLLDGGNGGNGVTLHYLNAGTFVAVSEDINEDINFNGILDAGEDLDFDGILDVANGILDAGEDLNGNGLLDQGIVSNTFRGNTGTGLYIFGDGSGTGDFMLGGPSASLGNTATGNTGAGFGADLTGTATAGIDSMFNTSTTNGSGFLVSAVDNSHLTQLNSINDTITLNTGVGFSLNAENNTIVDTMTIQGDTLTQNGGRGINIEAHNNSLISVANIGGFDTTPFDPANHGLNFINGSSFSEANTISQNGSDGVRVLAGEGATISGNITNNTITLNGGNGAALQIDDGGFLNFGNAVANQQITRNTITDNTGAGILMVSNVSAATEAQLDALVTSNTVANNVGGGLVAQLNGPNNNPPAPPILIDNNRLNLTVGGTTAALANTFTGNTDVGIGVEVLGNGLANVNLTNNSVTGTVDGADARWNGDGVGLIRRDSSLLTATIDGLTSTGNAGDGLDVMGEGNDKTDPNQPNSGTANTVTTINSTLSNNTGNGASYRVAGDVTLVGDMQNVVADNNGLNGIAVTATQAASFGDPTDGLPPGRRAIFDGISASNNGNDGIQLNAADGSRVNVNVTSNTILAPLPSYSPVN
ncbi:MAG: inverse autotransporter beta domain-containing protein, partial [Planctomycetaceae bacterium]|nr:inverse autotransporter beta domain-containing protein [Planctomycetaceae bacterium]